MTHPHALLIEDLEFTYAATEDDRPFTLSVPRLSLGDSEQLLLTATSGGGKSTLLGLIAGLMEPRRGRVVVAGRDVHALTGARRDHFRGRHIGMIFQTFNLLQGFSAIENVMAALLFSEMPAKSHRERAAALLNKLGIDRPDRLVERLSIGQQQRVAVARALACGPELVLADEPTASLDPENALAAIDLIQSECRGQGAALLCVSHDPAMLNRFPRHEKLSGPVPAEVRS